MPRLRFGGNFSRCRKNMLLAKKCTYFAQRLPFPGSSVFGETAPAKIGEIRQ